MAIEFGSFEYNRIIRRFAEGYRLDVVRRKSYRCDSEALRRFSLDRKLAALEHDISRATLVEFARLAGSEAIREAVWNRIVKEGLSFRDVAYLVRHMNQCLHTDHTHASMLEAVAVNVKTLAHKAQTQEVDDAECHSPR